jgi:hypothetical protein
MKKYQGTCGCKSTIFRVQLPEPLNNYSPRSCDCQFCASQNAVYLSDPNGKLEIVFEKDPEPTKQGSEQAKFLYCPTCGDLVCVVCSIEGQWRGAINIAISPVFSELQNAVLVSPRLLSAQEKIDRWNFTWFFVEIDCRG